jgi:crotonobetainyl-CoA:carnitine CoA-transferase CaiB-like acyl-CoA transferase
MSTGALEGIAVVELGQMVAAPFCAKLLADLGADVIKIEAPRVGDPARRRGPFPEDMPHPERSGLFLYLNTSKQGITLDPRTASGQKIFRELVREADVLIEDRAPGEMERLGLGWSVLSELNPRLVMTSITPFGQTGPFKDHKAHHLNLYHGSGHSSFFYVAPGEGAERPPARGGGYLGEYDAGLTAAVGTLAAVLRRNRSGRGDHVDVSAQDAMLCLERVDVGRLTNDPNPQPWRGQVGGLLKAKDGYVMITPAQNHQWQGLVRAMGEPEWTKADWCQDEVKRMENRERLQPLIDAWAQEHTREEIYHRTQAEGAPSGPVQSVGEVRAWRQAEARGFFREIEHPAAGTQAYPTAAYAFSETPWQGAPAPLLGQHNEAVYCSRLGYARADLARLAATGVI